MPQSFENQTRKYVEIPEPTEQETRLEDLSRLRQGLNRIKLHKSELDAA